MVEQGAAPAGEARNLALGRLRDPARAPLWALCEELAGLGRAVSPESRKRGLELMADGPAERGRL